MLRKKLVIVVVAVAAVAGGGAAIAATGSGTPQEESKAIIDDAAEELGVSPAELSDALEKALAARVDAAVAAGRITEEQGEELKERIASGELPLVGVGRGFGHHHHGPGVHFGGLDAAATYLGVTAAELRTALESGKSLADVARDEGKSVDGLVDALEESAAARLNEAVEDGRLTDEQRDAMLEDLDDRITDLVNGNLPVRRGFHGRPPAFEPPASAPA